MTRPATSSGALEHPVCRERCPACRSFLRPTADPTAREALVCVQPGCPAGDAPSSFGPELE